MISLRTNMAERIIGIIANRDDMSLVDHQSAYEKAFQ